MVEEIIDMRFENARTDSIMITQEDGAQLFYFCGGKVNYSPVSLYFVMRKLMEVSQAERYPKYQEIVKRCYDNISSGIRDCLLEIREHALEDRREAEQKKKQDANARAKLFYEEYQKLTDKYGIFAGDADSPGIDYVLPVDGGNFYYYDTKGEG